MAIEGGGGGLGGPGLPRDTLLGLKITVGAATVGAATVGAATVGAASARGAAALALPLVLVRLV